MSESGAAVDRGDTVEEDDCPLCLEPLPPFWETKRRVWTPCCGRSMCQDCYDKQSAYLERASANGFRTVGERRAAEQLASTCALCRSLRPMADLHGRVMKDRFDKGQLPLSLYSNLGINYVNGEQGLETDVERGIEILKLGAEKGDPNCQFSMGARYLGMHGLPQSATEAKRWFTAATKQGHAIAECFLAALAKDEGNDVEYLQYLRGSASKGYDNACFSLGYAHYEGKYGLQKSSEEAIRVATPAAERGHVNSMCILGAALWQPVPLVAPTVNPNFTKGVHWLRRAAATGDQSAITNLEAMEEAKSSVCFMCSKKAPPEKAFLRCSRCRAAWYCNKECQVQHWRAEEGGHKRYCIKWK